jgi:hypothetical protein
VQITSIKTGIYGLDLHEEAVPGTYSIRPIRTDSVSGGHPLDPADSGRFGRVGSSARPWRRRADRGPEASKLSEIGRLRSGVGEGNRTPGLQNHNLAL